jgi:hypothetical protein
VLREEWDFVYWCGESARYAVWGREENKHPWLAITRRCLDLRTEKYVHGIRLAALVILDFVQRSYHIDKLGNIFMGFRILWIY